MQPAFVFGLYVCVSMFLSVATAGEKIQHIRLTRKPRVSQKRLADLLGLGATRDVIANYENNRTEPEERHVKKLARLWGIEDPDWFWDGGDVEPPAPIGSLAPGQSPPAPIPGFATPGAARRKFPLIGSAGAATFPLASTADPEDYVEFSDELYRPERYAIRLVGDSMEPRIPADCYVLVQPHENPPVGMIVVARSGEYEYAVKVRRVNDGEIVLVPINPNYETITTDEGWRMVGYVVAYRKNRDPKGKKYIEEGDDDGLRP
jgi:SOS-response transcriptional repressor LexA